MKQALIALLACGVVLAQTKTGTATKSTAPAAAPKAAGAPNLMDPATLKSASPATYNVKFTTTKGDITIQVTRSWAPNGADRFYNLVRAGFFTNSSFFRVIPNFMAQFGMSAVPAVARALDNANFRDDPVLQSNKRGFVSFANTGSPNTRGTQLFINYKDNSFLDRQLFAPIGIVTEGMEVADKFNSEYGGDLDQQAIRDGGKAYMDSKFPRMDRILTAKIVPAAGAAPAAAGAAPKADTKK